MERLICVRGETHYISKGGPPLYLEDSVAFGGCQLRVGANRKHEEINGIQ